MAVEMPVARPVARRAERGISRRPLRDDAPRSHRRHLVGGRSVCRHHRVVQHEIDRPYIGRLNVEHWSLGMERALKFRAGGTEDRFYDIDFRAMQNDPIGEVVGLYAWLGAPVGAEFEARMQERWWEHAAAEHRVARGPGCVRH